MPVKRAAAGSPPPEQAEQDRRGELRDGAERDQPDGDQRVALADDPEVGVAEQQQPRMLPRRIVSSRPDRSGCSFRREEAPGAAAPA